MTDQIKENRKNKFFYLVIIFALISFAGWCIETLYFKIVWNDFTDRGFLSLPFCTIYGSGIIIIYLLIGTPTKGRLRPLFVRADKLPATARIAAYLNLFIIYFAIAALTATAAEFFTGLFFDKIFGITLWDYNGRAHNLYGYICVEMSLIWGAAITAAMGLIWPALEKAVHMITPEVAKIIAVLLLVCISADFIFNLTYLCIHGAHFILY